jgi:electron transport complex protein RnfD
MFVPEGYSLFSLFFITLISLFVFSYMFGGFAQSWGNPIAITVILLYLIGTQFFPDFTVTASHLQNPNLGQQLVNEGLIPKINLDESITNFLNGNLFRYAGVALPEGYVSIFWDTGSLIPAFRFNLLTIFAIIVLLAFGGIKWIIPSVFIFVYGLLVRIFGLFPYGGILNQGDILLAIFSSGTMVVAFLLLQWPGTTPLTIVGKVIYGVLAGVFAFLIMGAGTSPIGAMFVILLSNLISPLIQLLEDLIYQQILKAKGKKYDFQN